MNVDDTARIFGDRYVLSERLTAGPEREVWRAHDDLVSRQVALKIFFGAKAADEQWQAGFRHVADRLVALSHPGIAKVYEHGESSGEAWLAMAFVPGRSLADRLADGGWRTAYQALDLIGQTALALGAAHDAGIVHGNLAPESLMVRDSGVVSLIGFAVEGSATRETDLDAVATLATALLDGPEVSTSPHSSDVKSFVTSLSSPTRGDRPRDANEIGRTALALAAALGGTSTAPEARLEPAHDTDLPRAGYGPTHDEAEKRMVRNRLIVLGTIVVVGGAALLRFIGEGGGEVTVPAVTNLQVDQAQLQLTKDGLRSTEQCLIGVDSGGTITSQSPVSGHQVKAGSVVVLTVTQDSCR